jgi:DNA polymerase-4
VTVLYAEVPGFYAEVERSAHPELRGRAVLVGGDPRKSGTVQSATPEALAGGVVPGMRVLEALERCPRARPFRTDMRRYREVSARLRAALRRSVERLEPAGLGAAYLDAGALARPAEDLARDLAKAVGQELGLPLRVGIAATKFLARLAAEEAGTAGVRRVAPAEEAAFLAPLPVERLPGVGPATANRLAELGARRIGELARLDRGAVEAALGVHGHTIWELAQGRDPSRVRPTAHRKSLSQESSFHPEEVDSTAILARLGTLSEGLALALAREELRARKVTLKVRYADQERVSRSCTVEPALSSAAQLHERAGALLARTQAGSRPVRGIGIVLGGLAPARREDRQLDLFGRRD